MLINLQHMYPISNESYYSGPSLSGNSKQRPHSLLWPEIFATTSVNTF